MTRPTLADLWKSFADVAPGFHSTYPTGVAADLRKIGKRIGGAVQTNFEMGAKEIENSTSYPTHPQGFTNGCATRMSYVLNNNGVQIPAIAGETVTGVDHKNYIFRVRSLDRYLRKVFGVADIVRGATTTASAFAGKRGIIEFAVGFSDASGHICP